jgi:hypothetical protein
MKDREKNAGERVKTDRRESEGEAAVQSDKQSGDYMRKRSSA